ncbi:hypothetical protein ABIE89_000502 [Bradyrhizobium niftali]
MQHRLGQRLTGNSGWQLLQCPVQIVSKESSRASLGRREIGAMPLRIPGKKCAKNFPCIVKSLSIPTRLSVRDYIGAERIAGQIGVASELIESIKPNEYGWYFPSATDPSKPVSHGTLYSFM